MRPSIFARMGKSFGARLGNVDARFTINGVEAILPVRVILRTGREINEIDPDTPGIEAATYSLSVAASSVPGLRSQRDLVTILPAIVDGVAFAGGTYAIKNLTDDAHAMLRLSIEGDIR